MRLMIFALGVLFLAGFVSAISADCDIEMVAYYEMEGNADDSFGSHDGSGWPGTDFDFVVGEAADFTQLPTAQVITISDSDSALALVGGDGLTIEFWVQKESPVSVDAFLLKNENYEIKWTSADKIEATVTGNAGSATVISGPLTPGNPYHVVLTWRAVASNLSLYVNNTLHDSAALVNSGSSSDPLLVGQDFVGLIDELALYNRFFDADDVNIHYKTSRGGWDYCHLAAAGDVSSTQVDFTLPGCKIPGEDYSISAGSCSRNGMYYCGNISLFLYYTLGGHEILPGDRGCSLEQQTYTKGETQCCPSGYLCGDDVDTEESELVCNLRTVDCVNLTQEGRDKCDKAGCFWLEEEGGICVDNPLDYSCSIYISEVSCELDVWNVGAAGMGTEVCGTYFIVNNQGYVIPQDSCKCDWTTSDKCVLGYDVVPDIYGDVANTFRCQKDFDAGDCIDGLQQVTWSAEGIQGTGIFNSSVPATFDEAEFSEVLEAAGCVTDDVGISRSCGEPIIKLPGFSLFALISSLAIIGLVYFWKRD